MKTMYFFLTTILLLNASVSGTKMDFFKGLVVTLKEIFELAITGKTDRVHPEAIMTTLEIVRYYGYFGEKHDVVTQDGYILEIHRIPLGKHNSTRHPRPPILLQHGISASSSSWVLNKQQSIAFLLADEGYDVWLGNVRGNTYCKRHIKLTSKDKRFWNFNLDDHARFDLGATIDYILNFTHFENLTYIGYSLGGTIGTLLLAGSPEYNSKVKLAILASPVLYTRYQKNPLRILEYHSKLLSDLYRLLGSKQVSQQSPLLKKLILLVCTHYPGVILCQAMMNIVGGYDEPQLDWERAHVAVVHGMEDTSVDVFLQYCAMFNTDKIVYFDYGPDGNLQKYGKSQSPVYNLSKVTSPTAIFYGYMDLYIDQRDIERSAKEITGLKLLELVPYKLWNHLDYLVAKNAKELFYDRLISLINTYN